MQNVNRKFKIWGALLFLLFFAVGVSMYFTAANVQAATKTGFVTINGDSYYINEDGSKQKGWLELEGKKYYFNTKTGVQVKGWVTDSKGRKRYFSKQAGIMMTGWVTDSKDQKRYFNPSTGFMQTKWLTLKGKRYYFYSNSGVAACKTFLTDSKKNTRYFTSACYMLTGWTKNSSNEYRYFETEDGIMAKGFQTLDGKKYYFNEKGIQQNGWQKIKGDYYFFQIRNGCYASMVTSRRVNGIYLTKSGEARYNSEEKRKLNLMVTANQVMRRVTKRNMSKPEKLWRCYLKAVSYGYGGTGNDYDFRYYYSNWDVSYAEDMFYRGHGDCFAFASAFAYLANAVGFEAKVISSGGHGWAEIKGEVCDPNWAKGTGHIERYYRMSYDLSGVDGRPYYRGNRAYVITI